MKLILSRKGFDSANGQKPSPIFPDGTMFSLPIPSQQDPVKLKDLRHDAFDVAAHVSELTRGRLGAENCVHLDPDIYSTILPRRPGWVPALGQSGAAQSHLAAQGVGPGDLFLFYGWFRDTELTDKQSGSRGDRHVIFGWLQIGSVWNINTDRDRLLAAHPGVADHPHLAALPKYQDKRNNFLYVAATELRIPGVAETGLPGGGAFAQISAARTLTAASLSRRYWQLPRWFVSEGRPSLSYHGNPSLWTDHGDSLLLKSAAIGQEFVTELPEGPEPGSWLRSIFGISGSTQTSMSDTRIYRYIVRTDRGTAPNPFDGYCTLAICKPKIRKTARVGDWVVGFRSRRRGEVLYAMQVAESLSFVEYWNDPRFRNRRPDRRKVPTDNIYRPASSSDPDAETYDWVPNSVHSATQARRDLSGKRVVVATKFWYFGDQSQPIPPELLHLAPVTQGHVVNLHGQPDDLTRLTNWLASYPQGVQGEPVDWSGAPLTGPRREAPC